MKRIGLTGGIACGKSSVAELLRRGGVAVIDADAVAREVVAPGTDGLRRIAERFGAAVLTPDGALDRGALGAIVVADPQARADLEAITHPAIRAHIARWFEAQAAGGEAAAVVEAALLVETGSYRHYDGLLVVACSPPVQRTRLMARNGWDAARADKWLAAQLPIAEKVAVADAVIDNGGTPDELEVATAEAWAALMA